MPLETEKAQGQQQPLYTPPGPPPIIFEDFSGGLNTNSTRPGIKDNELWWSDGFFPIAANYLRTIPDVGTFIFDSSNPTGGGPSPPPESSQLWVVGSSCELMQWSLTATGNDDPVINIQGVTTTLTGPEGSDNSFTYAVDIDSSGNQYALNYALLPAAAFLYSIPIFAKNATGDVAPVKNIQGAATNLNGSFGPTEVFAGGICLDGSANIYAGARTTILKFAAGSDGNVASTTFLSDAGLDQVSSLFFDAARQLIWVSTFNPDVRAYDLTGTMQRQLTYSDFSGPFEVYIGPDGSIFVSDSPRDNGPCVFVFAPTANGADAPIRTLILPNSAINLPEAVCVAVASTGVTFASYIDDSSNYHVASFAAGANGMVTPITDITNPLLTTMLDSAATYPTQLRVV